MLGNYNWTIQGRSEEDEEIAERLGITPEYILCGIRDEAICDSNRENVRLRAVDDLGLFLGIVRKGDEISFCPDDEFRKRHEWLRRNVGIDISWLIHRWKELKGIEYPPGWLQRNTET